MAEAGDGIQQHARHTSFEKLSNILIFFMAFFFFVFVIVIVAIAYVAVVE